MCVYVKARLQDTIVAYDFSFWSMQCCCKSTVPVYDWLANVPTLPEDVRDLIVYVTTNDRIRQSYLEDGALVL